MGTELDKKGELLGKQEVSPINALDRAEAIAARVEAANQRAAELLKENTELATRNILGGRSEVSQPAPVQEISNREYAKNALRGVYNVPQKK
jgi:hypothetical protein